MVKKITLKNTIMTTTNYQVKKEQAIVDINKIGELIENNQFEESTKEKVAASVEKATIAILENRNEVHKFVHEDNADIIAFHKKETLAGHQKNNSKENTKYVAHEAMEMAAKLKNEPSSGVIMDEVTLKKYIPTEEFKNNESVVNECLNDIINTLQAVGSKEEVVKKPRKKKTEVKEESNPVTEEVKEEVSVDPEKNEEYSDPEKNDIESVDPEKNDSPEESNGVTE